jgi:hypothetical protein
MKKCGRCQIEKEDTEFSKSQLERSGGICRPCCTEKARNYRNTHRDEVRAYEKEYRPKYLEEHAEEKAAYQKEYYQDNREKFESYSKKRRENNRDELIAYAKEYYQENKKELRAKAKEYRNAHRAEKNKAQNSARKNNPNEKIRHRVSNLIRLTIQRQGSSKNGSSITKYIGYSIQELKDHLEKLFEPWMTWQNWGMYDLDTWDDTNPTTWTWQLDHIIPQAMLPYQSMEDDNFKKCWALDNLRPYSAKLNSIDGATRIRHT